MKKNLLVIIFASFCAGTLSAQNIAWPEVTTELNRVLAGGGWGVR